MQNSPACDSNNDDGSAKNIDSIISKQQSEKKSDGHMQQPHVQNGTRRNMVFRIETIFVMDEKPFKKQRQKVKWAEEYKIHNHNSTQFSPSIDKTIKQELLSFPSGVANLAAEDNLGSMQIESKLRTNSSQLPIVKKASGTGSNQADPLNKRKMSEQISPTDQQQDTEQIQHKDVVKNLLTEFEKDESLEPNSQIFTTKSGVTKLGGSYQTEVDSKEFKQLPKEATSRQNAKAIAVDEDRSDAYNIGRQERRIADQAPRKNAAGVARQLAVREKNYNNQDKIEPLQINLSNLRKQSQNEGATVEELENAGRGVKVQSQQQSKIADESVPQIKIKTNTPQKPKNDSITLEISPRRKGLFDKFTLNDFFEGQPELKVRFTEVVRKFNLELMKSTCQVMKGCKSWKAKQIADSVFGLLNEILQRLYEKHETNSRLSADAAAGDQEGGSSQINVHSNSNNNNTKINVQQLENNSQSFSPGQKIQKSSSFDNSSLLEESQVYVVKQITTSATVLKEILNFCFKVNSYQKPDCLKDFLVASLLMQSKINVIVLLAGTSGTGKSTLASLLGTRLGISTVLSTDSVRHVMRNFLREEDNPTLFCSTYEAGNTVSAEDRENASEMRITLKGYKQQCSLVTKELSKVIDSFYQRNESLVVEGVHLTMSFVKEMMAKYPSCIPFVLYIKNKNKHGERFAVRAKHMTIDPKFNKYISNIQHIRTIQEYLLKKSEEILIPRIENHNVDRSVSLIQATIMKCLHRISEGGQIYDAQQKRATGIHKEIQKIQKNQLSSKQAQSVINEKVDKIKVVESFLESQNNKADWDPDFQRKLKQHRPNASLKVRTVNIWKTGEFSALEGQDDDDDELGNKKKRTISITNILPQIGATDLMPEERQSGAQSQPTYYKLSKAEKKQIKRELKEFAKKSHGLTKENLLRKNLIQTEEDYEAKICEGSQASSILKDHRKNKKKLQAKPEEQSQDKQQNEITNVAVVASASDALLPKSQHQPQTIETALIQPELLLTAVKSQQFEESKDIQITRISPVRRVSSSQDLVDEFIKDEDEKKLIAKKLLSDKQKENELLLLKEAQRRAVQKEEAEETLQREESQQMLLKGINHSTLQKKKRNKSQELVFEEQEQEADAGGQHKSDGRSSQDSLGVAFDEDYYQRLRDVMDETEAAENLLNRDQLHQAKASATKIEIMEANKQQIFNIQQVNLMRVQDSQDEQQKLEPSHASAKLKFGYKLDQQQTGSADNLITQASLTLQQESNSKTNHKLSQFAKAENNDQASGSRDLRNQATNQKTAKNENRRDKRLKPEVESEIKRQSSQQQKKLRPQPSQQHHHGSQRKPQEYHSNRNVEEKKKVTNSRRDRHGKAMEKRSVTTNLKPTRGDARSHDNSQQQIRGGAGHSQAALYASSTELNGSEHYINSTSNNKKMKVKHNQTMDGTNDGTNDDEERNHINPQEKPDHPEYQHKIQKGGISSAAVSDAAAKQTSMDDGTSIQKTIEEEDSEYSQTIGSLVSYTINYMEKNTIRGAGGHSSRHDGDRIGEQNHSDSDDDDDHSMLVEKEEDSHSDIDTIEEEVDLSSEGSDHEEQQHEEKQQQESQIEATNAAQAAQSSNAVIASNPTINSSQTQAIQLYANQVLQREESCRSPKKTDSEIEVIESSVGQNAPVAQN